MIPITNHHWGGCDLLWFSRPEYRGDSSIKHAQQGHIPLLNLPQCHPPSSCMEQHAESHLQDILRRRTGTKVEGRHSVRNNRLPINPAWVGGGWDSNKYDEEAEYHKPKSLPIVELVAQQCYCKNNFILISSSRQTQIRCLGLFFHCHPKLGLAWCWYFQIKMKVLQNENMSKGNVVCDLCCLHWPSNNYSTIRVQP